MKNTNSLFIAVLLIGSCLQQEGRNPGTGSEGWQIKRHSHFGADEVRRRQRREPDPIADEFTAVGEVSFDENNVVRVFPIVSGTVEKVEVSLGDYVQRGRYWQTLLSTDISAYQRDYMCRRQISRLSKRNMTRAEDLYKSGMLFGKRLCRAKKDLANATLSLMRRSRSSNYMVVLQKDSTQHFRVVAPRSGYIVNEISTKERRSVTDLKH